MTDVEADSRERPAAVAREPTRFRATLAARPALAGRSVVAIGAAERGTDLPRAYSTENVSSPTGVVSARTNRAKLLLTPKFREQPLFAAVLPQRSTKLVAGSPRGLRRPPASR
ncbi:MAG: hypothetical protein IPN83_07220 [Holophagales bacterium]|nr:hypothetical protein [Holophagales bacterium]